MALFKRAPQHDTVEDILAPLTSIHDRLDALRTAAGQHAENLKASAKVFEDKAVRASQARSSLAGLLNGF